MAEGKKVSSVSFFNSRLTSIISISLVLFLLARFSDRVVGKQTFRICEGEHFIFDRAER